ncbi:unnamed protein product [Rotaria sp. Silwood2]|nr:unnamed protein product [Rotaria sp. Silwood2]CAF3946078.1 unnamed protein product [Rotaria sp. Silwood2]
MALQVVESREEGNVSILILGALYGYEDFVRVLLSWNSSPQHVNLRGNVKNDHGNLIQGVTALWCALEKGHYSIASILINEGKADIFCGPRESLFDYFIKTGRLDVIQFLVDNDYATVKTQSVTNKSYYYYLDLAASSDHTNIVIYFLSKGDERDIRKGIGVSNALHLAAKKGHYDCVRLLCNAGLSPKRRDVYGNTPLRIAAVNKHFNIVDFFLEYNNDEASFNELELLASSYINVNWQLGINDQFHQMYNLLEQSLIKRLLLNIPKAVAPPIAAYEFQRECQSIDELESIQHDADRLILEALLIRERLLLPEKDKTLLVSLRQRGITLAERGEFDQCFQLWLHTFRLHQQLESDIDLQNFVWLFCRMFTAGISISIVSFLQICYITFASSQQKFTGERVATSLYLVAIAAKLLEQDTMTSVDRHAILQWIRRLCRQQPITEDTAQTLLHLCVTDRTYQFIRLLLHCGHRWIDLDAVDRIYGDTALHRIARSWTDVNAIPIIEFLINAGAHIDCLNNYKQMPINVAKTTAVRSLLQSKQRLLRLKCLCARLITNQQINYDSVWPVHTALNRFIVLHGDLSRKHELSDEDSLIDGFDLFD